MKVFNTKSHGNPSTGSRYGIFVQTDRPSEGQKGISKLIGPFCDYTNTPKIRNIRNLLELSTSHNRLNRIMRPEVVYFCV
jgi:hypothetical protein